jgi:uncharacterized heparinase superfamily protein
MRRKDPFDNSRGVLAVGGAMFDDRALMSSAGAFHHEALWILGTAGFEKFRGVTESGVQTPSRVFAQSGFAVLRSEGMHIIVHCDDVGRSGKTGHGHNDTASFELWVRGYPFIVDPGTFTYSSDRSLRDRFRSVHAHNTLVVDGKEPAAFTGLWKVSPETYPPELGNVSSVDDRETLTLSRRLETHGGNVVIHLRTFELAHASSTLTITDEVEGDCSPELLVSFHVHPLVSVEVEDNNGYILRREGTTVRLRMHGSRCEVTEDWFSPSYGVKTRSKTVRSRWRTNLPQKVRTVITPA